MNLKKTICFLLFPLPSFLKIFCYRTFFKYQIAEDVTIGFSVIMVEQCAIGQATKIGHFNFISNIINLNIGEDVSIGHFNIILGGDSVELGDGAVIGRFNEINSIINPLISNQANPVLFVRRRAVITAWHKIDYTDCIVIGESAIIAGRYSCLWTHNRQQVKAIEIGRNCYIGSGVQFAPGTGVGSHCVVGLGSVFTKFLAAEYSLIGGVPARIIKPLDADSRVMVEFPTRPDLDE